MDYEKLYKEALERAKSFESPEYKNIMASVFPELQESDDERIRKEIIDVIRHSVNSMPADSFNERIAWLEKQNHDGKKWIYEDVYLKEKEQLIQDGIDEVLENPQKYGLEKQGEQKQWPHVEPLSEEDKLHLMLDEQKPVDKVEPKFKVRDWIVTNISKYVFLIKSFNSGYFTLEDINGNIYTPCLPPTEDDYHLWTIQDAKDDDVLACNEEILLFKSYSVQNRISLYCWYNGQTNNFHSKGVNDTLLTTRNKIYPATKEQRDLLFQKIHEAGYMWDSESKQLLSLKAEPIKPDDLIEESYQQQADDLIDMVTEKPAWSEEDEKILNLIIARLHSHENVEAEEYNKDYHWLKSLKDRVQSQPKQEWSEEDESILQGIWDEILANKHDAKEYEWKTYDKFLNWLKSLRPQNTWKPSEEQLEVLREALAHIPDEYDVPSLTEIYEQLKKLKGE